MTANYFFLASTLSPVRESQVAVWLKCLRKDLLGLSSAVPDSMGVDGRNSDKKFCRAM